MKLTDPFGCHLTTMKVWSTGRGRLRCENNHEFYLEECSMMGVRVGDYRNVFIEAFHQIIDIILASHQTNEPTPFDDPQEVA